MQGQREHKSSGDIYGFFAWFKRQYDTDISTDYVRYLDDELGIKVDIERIKNVVCRNFEVPEGIVYTKTRVRSVADARRVIYFFLRTRYTLSKIGLICGGKDHSSVLIAISRFYDLYQTNHDFRILVDRCLNELNYTMDNNFNLKSK